jgi:hypothetical protein
MTDKLQVLADLMIPSCVGPYLHYAEYCSVG